MGTLEQAKNRCPLPRGWEASPHVWPLGRQRWVSAARRRLQPRTATSAPAAAPALLRHPAAGHCRCRATAPAASAAARAPRRCSRTRTRRLSPRRPPPLRHSTVARCASARRPPRRPCCNHSRRSSRQRPRRSSARQHRGHRGVAQAREATPRASPPPPEGPGTRPRCFPPAKLSPAARCRGCRCLPLLQLCRPQKTPCRCWTSCRRGLAAIPGPSIPLPGQNMRPAAAEGPLGACPRRPQPWAPGDAAAPLLTLRGSAGLRLPAPAGQLARLASATAAGTDADAGHPPGPRAMHAAPTAAATPPLHQALPPPPCRHRSAPLPQPRRLAGRPPPAAVCGGAWTWAVRLQHLRPPFPRPCKRRQCPCWPLPAPPRRRPRGPSGCYCWWRLPLAAAVPPLQLPRPPVFVSLARLPVAAGGSGPRAPGLRGAAAAQARPCGLPASGHRPHCVRIHQGVACQCAWAEASVAAGEDRAAVPGLEQLPHHCCRCCSALGRCR
jgi:hypothetical protein